MPKQSPWQIRVGRKNEVITEFEVPRHKLDKRELENFLRAIVVRYITNAPEDMALYYVNRRAGSPQRLPLADVDPDQDLDRCLIGYRCGNWDCHATAMHKIPEGQARAMRSIREANRWTKCTYE